MEKIMKTYVDYPPRKLQSIGYTGPIKISDYQRLEWVRQQLATEGITLTMPTGN
jgi:arylsulfatase